MGKAYVFDPEERIDWELQKEQQEQKKTAASAFKKPRRRGCRMPSDYLTKKQKQALNGEVKVMNIHKPMTYKYFKTMPKEIQEEYLTYLRDTFRAAISDIAKMMGCNANALSFYINHTKKTGLNVTFPRGQSKLDKEAWAKWLNASESDEKALCETNDSSEGSEPVSENAPESDEKPNYDFDQVMNNVAAGFITLNDAKDILGIQVPEGMTKEEWLDELNKSFDEFAERQKKAIEDKNQERICDLKAEIERLKKELANRAYVEEPFPFEQKPLNLKIDRFSITLDDIRSWDEVFELLRYVKIPKENSLMINLTNAERRYPRPFVSYGRDGDENE